MNATTVPATVPPAPDYTAPAVLDAGSVTKVTLGIMKSDKVDDTQYKYSA